MDSDDDVIPAGCGNDDGGSDLEDLLEQPAEEAQAPRLSRLKRKGDAGNGSTKKTKKRSVLPDSPQVQ